MKSEETREEGRKEGRSVRAEDASDSEPSVAWDGTTQHGTVAALIAL